MADNTTVMRLREIFEFTTYGNKAIPDWINERYKDQDLSREAAFATVRWLARTYPQINDILRVTTTVEGGKEK